MSTRYVKNNDTIIVGLAKNGSQSVKQISLRYGWDMLNETYESYNNNTTVNFLDFNNPNISIYLPLRDGIERARSEFIQHLYDIFIYESNHRNIEYFFYKEVIPNNYFVPRWNYFDNTSMKFFINNIFYNESWNGCKFYFFDLNNFNEKFSNHIGLDFEIPKVNTGYEREGKVFLNENISLVDFTDKFINKMFLHHFKTVDNLILNKIKKSKHWIDLNG